MDPFIQAFFAVDRNNAESITYKELEDYVRQNNMDQAMITRWRALFDSNDTGVITLDEFCRVLGLKVADVRRIRGNRVNAAPAPKVSDVQVISVTLTPSHQNEILDYLRQVCRSDTFDENVVSKQLKKFLDDRYGRMWQVVISRTSLWSSFSYEPNTTFFFHFRKHIFLLWKNSD